MSALSQSLTFSSFSTGTLFPSLTTGTVAVVYPNTTNTTVVFVSDKVKGDGYFGASDGLHTVMYVAEPTFAGTITMQATLATSPVESDWFNVANTDVNYTALQTRTTSTVDACNFIGNFVWVRGNIAIDAGTVSMIQYNH